MNHKILRLPRLLDQSGYSRSTLYQRIADGLWTRPVPIGLRAVGWPESEVSALIAARIAGQSQAEIRTLVLKLQAARSAALQA
jgi:prophage regulatory protein